MRPEQWGLVYEPRVPKECERAAANPAVSCAAAALRMLPADTTSSNKHCPGEVTVFQGWTVSGMVAPFCSDPSWDFEV